MKTVEHDGEQVFYKKFKDGNEIPFYRCRIELKRSVTAFDQIIQILNKEFGQGRRHWHFGSKKRIKQKLKKAIHGAQFQVLKRRKRNVVIHKQIPPPSSTVPINVYVNTDYVDSSKEIVEFIDKIRVFQALSGKKG